MRNTLSFLFFLVSLVFSTTLCAASVFKVSDGQRTLYLGGTMHLLSPSDYPLPAQYLKAYSNSDAVVFETDIASLSSLQFQHKMQQQLTFTDGSTLDDHLASSTITMLKAHLASRGIPYDSMKFFKPSFAGIALTTMELAAMGLTAEGVDAHFHGLALNDGKSISWFESPTEQIAFMAKMGEGNSDEYIQYALNDIKTLPENMQSLKIAWQSGNLKELEAVGIAPWVNEYPEMYELLLSSRNNNWMPELEALLASKPTEFVLVGALHLVGKDGLLQQLKAKGFTVEKL